MFYICFILYRTWKLKVIFMSNEFPARVIDSCFNCFIEKKFSNLPKALKPKHVIYFPLPYTGTHFLLIKTQINELLLSAFPHLGIWFVAKPMQRLSIFLKFKDSTPKGLRSHVTYKITCQGCGALYVSETVRQLHTRTSEHMGITPVFGKK